MIKAVQVGSGGPASQQRGVGESEAEHVFWCRYWEVLRSKGVPAGKEVWYERACVRFIRESKLGRLKQAQPEDVTQFLGLPAQQAESAAWKVRQADEVLRIVFQEMVRCAWRAEQWPVGLPESDGWMEGPEGGGKMPVPADSAQARFGN